MLERVIAEISPTGKLRAAINTANFLLVNGTNASGDPAGIAPDVAREIAKRLGVPVSFAPFAKASEIGDSVNSGVWDIAFIGAEPARAEKIFFTAAYVEIEATYLVAAGSAITSLADVDRPGVRISVGRGSAYDLWLTRHIANAELVRAPNVAASYQMFIDDKLEVLAGLRPGLISVLEKLPDARILDDRFTSVQQAVGTARDNRASAAFLAAFIDEAKRSGFIAKLIEQNGIQGLSVAKL